MPSEFQPQPRIEPLQPLLFKESLMKTAGSHPNSHFKMLLETLVGDDSAFFRINLGEPHNNQWPECRQSLFLQDGVLGVYFVMVLIQ